MTWSDFSRALRGLGYLVTGLTSPMALAMDASWVEQQSSSTLSLILMGLSGIAVVLLVLLMMWQLRLKKAQKTEMAQQAIADHKQILLQDHHQAIIHLNPELRLCFANKVAMWWLGIKDIGQQPRSAAELFPDQAMEAIQQAYDDGVPARLQCYFERVQRHVLVDIHPRKQQDDGIAVLISLQDVSQYQNKLDEAARHHSNHLALLNHGNVGLITLNLNSNELLLSNAVAELLCNDPENRLLSTDKFRELIAEEERIDWDEALKLARQGQAFAFKGKFICLQNRYYLQLAGLITDTDDKDLPQEIQMILLDCTEQANERKQRFIAQQQVKSLLLANAHPMYVLDVDGKVLDCNTPFQRMFNTTLMQIQGKTLSSLSFVTDELSDLHDSSNMLMSSMSSGNGRELDLTLKDEQVHKLRVKLAPVNNNDGEKVGMAGVIEDMTELRALRHDLEEERLRFATILDMAPVAITIVDGEDNILQANHALVERLDLSEKELKEGGFYQLFSDPNQSAKAARMLHQSGRLRQFQADLRGKRNERHPSELHVDLFNKEKQLYLCWIDDITDKKFQQDKFDNLLEHSSMPMAVLSDEGFSYLNPAASRFFNTMEADALNGKYPWSEQLNMGNDDTERLKRKLHQIKLDGQAQSLVWQHNTGEEPLPCQATYVPMFKGKELESILCIWMDMRAINKADKARQQAIDLQQAAERDAQEKHLQLQTREEQLAKERQNLADTQSQLQAAHQDISAKQSTISNLEQAHKDISANLDKLQQDYSQSRAMLAESQQSNAELESQLAESSERVTALQNQRNQIADALQNSERQYKQSQAQLAESEQLTEKLRHDQQTQQSQMQAYVEQIGGLKSAIDAKDKQLNDVTGQISQLQSQLQSSDLASEKLKQQLINQRKASEEAEQQRRVLEEQCRLAQSELSGKARHIEHLQHEMQMFEEMSQQQRGDMEAQQQRLQQELEAKQSQLQQTMQDLEQTRQQSEQEKAEKAAQEQMLQQLQSEMQEVQQRAQEQQQKMQEADQYWQNQQQALQQELQAKQDALQQTEAFLKDAKQQTEAEKAEKARQQQIFENLKSELAEMEQRSSEQQRKMNESDQQWQQRQQALNAELEAKQSQLSQTQQQLDENQRLADVEKHERMEQQKKLDQLKVELQDVEGRAARQREMMAGSDEQWRQHQEEMEAQKAQLQQALEQAKAQNQDMEKQLAGSLQQLEKAESQVQETQSGEQKLQQELERAKQEAEALKNKLQQQEQQENSLQQQLAEQQKALQSNESNISALKNEQKELTEQLQRVQQEYSHTKQSLTDHDSNQSALHEQLKELESALKQSKDQLQTKEQSLQSAQQELQASKQKMQEQEQALVAAHKEELKQVQETTPANNRPVPEFASLPMPDEPEIWFNLLPYLQSNPSSGSLASALNELMDELYEVVQSADTAIKEDNVKDILGSTRRLVAMVGRINSEPLTDLAGRLEAWCQHGNMDNISIFWPNARNYLMTTLRVIYSHLHA